VLKNALPMTKALFGMYQFLAQVSQIPTTLVLEFAAFEQVPHLFLRIPRWSVAREAFQVDAFAHRAGEKRFDHVRPMNGGTVPND
jgi:fatty-acid desaturase